MFVGGEDLGEKLISSFLGGYVMVKDLCPNSCPSGPNTCIRFLPGLVPLGLEAVTSFHQSLLIGKRSFHLVIQAARNIWRWSPSFL